MSTIRLYRGRHENSWGIIEGRPFEEEWDRTDWHCPKCGKQTVWAEGGGAGDFYVGPTHICISCRNRFWLPSDPEPVAAGNGDAARADALTELEPTAPQTEPQPSGDERDLRGSDPAP